MKLILAGKEYDINESMTKATLFDLYELKMKTGIGMKSLSDALERMGKLADPKDFLDDETILLALCALVWLCRRHAGESLTIEEANKVALADVQFKVDAADLPDEVEADPTPALTGSVQGDDDATVPTS
uniref:Uncharacterized protein n=1 Tax=uncultured organism TaxID=155900 RepID=A0A7L9QCH2_9ZZZZ|nr:hypothetical protein [uncultured organism]